MEPMEGLSCKELVSADSNTIALWDINKQKCKVKIDASQYANKSCDLKMCQVVKRDPHHKELLCAAIDNTFYQIDTRSPTKPSLG